MKHLAVMVALTVGLLLAATSVVANAAPARLDPGDYVNCPLYLSDRGVMVVDWQCLINTITYND